MDKYNWRTESVKEYHRSQDRRIHDGKAVEEMVQSRGWSLIMDSLTELRGQAHAQVLKIDDDTRRYWRGRMEALDEAIGLANIYIKDKEICEAERKEAKDYGQEDGRAFSDGEGDSLDDNGE